MKHKPADAPGQGAVEYALILVLVAVIFFTTLILFGPSFESILNQLINDALAA